MEFTACLVGQNSSSGEDSDNWSYAQSGQHPQQQQQQSRQKEHYDQRSNNQGNQYHHQNNYQGKQSQEQQWNENSHERPQSGSRPNSEQSNHSVGDHQDPSGEGGKCWECGATFQDDVLLRDHLALFHAEIPVSKCHSCSAVFPNQSTLTIHITTRHLVGASLKSTHNKSQISESEAEDQYTDYESEEDYEQQGQSQGQSSARSISISGGSSSISSILAAKGISVSGADSSLSSLQAKGISVSSSSSSPSTPSKGVSVSAGGDSSALSSLLQAKGISISGKDSSPLAGLQGKGISISGGDSSLSALQGKGISISGGDSSLSALQGKGISISGGDSSLSALQGKGISISGANSSLSALQGKGISISGGDSSLSALQGKGISISGSDTSLQSKGVTVSSGEDSLSYLKAKGISIGGASTSLLPKGISVSSAESNLQSKGVSVSGSESSLALKGVSISGGDSSLSSLQGKGISISGGSSSLSLLQSKGISISGSDSSSESKGVSVSGTDSPLSALLAKGISVGGADNSLSSLQAKGVSFSPAKSESSSGDGKGVALSSTSLAILQGKGISLSPAKPQQSSTNQLSSFESKEPVNSSDQLQSLGSKGVSFTRGVADVASLLPKGISLSAKTEEPAKGSGKAKRSRPKPRGPQCKRNEFFGCVYCRVERFDSWQEFEDHHLNHVKQTSLKLVLLKLNSKAHRDDTVDLRSRKKSSSIKLKLRISKVGRGRGRKRREVSIVSNEEGMSEGQTIAEEREESLDGDLQEEEGEETGGENSQAEDDPPAIDTEEEASRSSADFNNRQSVDGHSREPSPSGHDISHDQRQEQRQTEETGSDRQNTEQGQEETGSAPAQNQGNQGDYQAHEGQGSNTQFEGNNYNQQDLGFGTAGPSEAPPSTYQPQFESFPTSDWFSEYDSGSRIAAAMAGATTAENASEGGWAQGSEGSNPAYTTANTEGEKDGSDQPVNGGESQSTGEGGLFSQEVLGQESPEKNDRQGSFEQLCLNDAYANQGQNNSEGHPNQIQGDYSDQQQQDQHLQQQGVASDLLSELEYLNNSGQPPQSSQHGQIDGSPHSGGPSPHSAGPGTPTHLSSRGSNSGTPTSSTGQPTPPPTDTSFRALATSPMTSPTQATSPALHPGQSSTSPSLQQQQGSDQQASGVPRLTIANNLMAPTTTTNTNQATPTTNNQNAVGGMMNRYGGNQWPQAPGYSGSGAYGTNMPNANMAAPLRAALPPSVGMPYRPSPPARVRGRPPLMGQIGRPPLHQGAYQPTRGPGRPPASNILPPPLMPAPGGRGTMMPPLQRMHQGMYQGQRPGAPQQQNGTGKRPLIGGTHSPSKNARREDINVPSRQKDNECQIIAVANRSDGLPVISNVQGGGSGSNQRSGTSAAPANDSTINLSDSITLSVRAPAANDRSQRGEKSGDAGTVANLLASRGITVTPAAGERQEGGGRDDRRLPTAQELNLSSAISVHPPTQREREANESRGRDRDGFAVPQAPVRGSSSSSSSSNNVERPPRPPTVDLTQDVPSHGSQGTRHHCSQCDRSFPSASLLADHSRVHQQSQQNRMPFKCHLCTAGFSTQKGQQHHYQQFHQIHLSAGDIAIPLVDLRNPVNVQRMAALGIRSFLPLTNLQNRGAGGVVGIPVLTLENLRNGHMTLQQWGVSDVLSLGPAKTLNMPR